MVKEKTNKVERLPITNDYIFKRVFAFEGNFRQNDIRTATRRRRIYKIKKEHSDIYNKL